LETGLLERVEEAGGGNGTDPAPTPGSSLFDGAEELFDAQFTPVRDDGVMYGHECWVKYLPMDSDAMAKYESAGQKIRVDTRTRTVESAEVEVDRSVQELVLLVGTICDFCIPIKKKSKQGDLFIEETRGAGTGVEFRRNYFKTLPPRFRAKLVARCLEVNGIGPLSASR
jgi:hypothetical protein